MFWPLIYSFSNCEKFTTFHIKGELSTSGACIDPCCYTTKTKEKFPKGKLCSGGSMTCENYRSLDSILMKNSVSPSHQIHMKNVYREGEDSNGNDIHVYFCWHLWIPVWI